MPTECPIDLAGPALLPEWRYMMGTVWKKYGTYNGMKLLSTQTEPPDGWDDFKYFHEDFGEVMDIPGLTPYEIYIKEETSKVNHGSGYVLPAATYSADGRMTRAWVNLGEVKRPLRFRAVLLGRAMHGVEWTAELDTTAPWPQEWVKTLGELWPGGVDVEDEGHSLLIRVHPGTAPQKAGSWASTLTMTAHAGGKPAGTLELRMGFRTLALAEEVQTETPYDLAGWEGWKPSDAPAA